VLQWGTEEYPIRVKDTRTGDPATALILNSFRLELVPFAKALSLPDGEKFYDRILWPPRQGISGDDHFA
jgi:hypothetical protein